MLGRPRFAAALRRSEGLLRLAIARLLSLLGEGVHQAALAGVVLFSPESAATPPAITLAFGVLVLPYSLVGPFAAAALDRWDRRRVIATAGVLRAGTVAATIACVLFGALSHAPGLTAVFALTLVALGLGRLVNTGMTASLPHVVAPPLLPGANAFLVTAGSLASACGAVVALLVVGAVDGETAAVSLTLAVALLLGLAGCLTVFSLPRGHLGPPEAPRADADYGWARDAARTFATGLATGWRAASRSPLVACALTGIALERAAFGITTLGIVLYFRSQNGPMIAGIGGFSLVMGVYAAGMAFAAAVVPTLLRRLGGFGVIVVGALVAASAQCGISLHFSPAGFVIGGLFLGLGAQMVKLSGDFAMQTTVPDEYRGGVFALQDAVFNASFVAGAATIAWLIPADEVPPLVLAAAASLHLLLAATAVVARHRAPRT